MVKMVVKDGVQYRPEDAERLGIKADETVDVESSVGKVIRAGDAENKAVLSTATTTSRKKTDDSK